MIHVKNVKYATKFLFVLSLFFLNMSVILKKKSETVQKSLNLGEALDTPRPDLPSGSVSGV